MMRKFNKKKGSRRGAILVTVVFILAFAVIFIAAAMTLTQATRRRVYTEAESNQARLTVTSVAEAWYRAVDKCEFSDKALLAYFKANSGHGTTIRVKASPNASNVPGLETEGEANSTVSYTTMRLYRSPNVVGASEDKEYTYFADFSTYIDGQVEHVRAEMSYTPQETSGDGGPFSTQIDLYGKFGNNNLEVVGDGKDSDDLGNIFLVRNGGNNKDSGFSSYATMIYCDGTVTFKDEDFFSTDIVFLTGAKLKGTGDSGHFKDTSKIKNIFFFGDNNEDMFSGEKGNWSGKGINFYYHKRNNNNTKYTEGGNVIEINLDGTRADGASTSDAFKKKVQTYASYNNKYKKGGSEEFPTTDKFLASTAKTIKLSKTAPSSAEKMSLGEFLTKYNYKTYKKFAPSGTYLFTSDDSDHNLKKDDPIVIVLEGGSKYRFYFDNNKSFGLHGVVFIVHKPNKSEPICFCLEDGAKVYWPGDGSSTTSNYDNRVGGNGIFAVYGRDFDNAKAAYDFVKGITATNPRNFENTKNKGYSYRYDGKNEPCAMIIGMGNNQFLMDKNIVMEAFIGLFNDSYNANGDPKSTLSFRNNDSGVMYGRIMTDGLGFNNDGGSIKYPASPAASSITPTPPDIEPIISGFELKSMKYYYNL